MAYTPAATAYHGKTIHRIWVKNGDSVIVLTNPESPSISDPAGMIETTATIYHVVDEGTSGALLVQSRRPTQTYTERAANDAEFSRIKL